MSREHALIAEFGSARPFRVRPHPMGGLRTSLRNWLLPAPIEFSGNVASRNQVSRLRSRHLA
ncbi:MAG: hypothetical protein N2Z75_04320 [Meiothermus sp.]|uniref:hypothetical protein n=1 Tax=Meiothermus sp. TaxID=1955249 RepID=UPI0026008716|nr:hypothetical protein [Meiothermus sp.]MCS7068791.1 hypothetical protein [Meiothermus sp.]MCX7601150.1 hypothetical protein [Meiothermus sp.]